MTKHKFTKLQTGAILSISMIVVLFAVSFVEAYGYIMYDPSNGYVLNQSIKSIDPENFEVFADSITFNSRKDLFFKSPTGIDIKGGAGVSPLQIVKGDGHVLFDISETGVATVKGQGSASSALTIEAAGSGSKFLEFISPDGTNPSLIQWGEGSLFLGDNRVENGTSYLAEIDSSGNFTAHQGSINVTGDINASSGNLIADNGVVLAGSSNQNNIVSVGAKAGGRSDTVAPFNFFGGNSNGWNSSYIGIDSPTEILTIGPSSDGTSTGNFNTLRSTGDIGVKVGNIGTTDYGYPLIPNNPALCIRGGANGTSKDGFINGDTGNGTVGYERGCLSAWYKYPTADGITTGAVILKNSTTGYTAYTGQALTSNAAYDYITTRGFITEESDPKIYDNPVSTTRKSGKGRMMDDDNYWGKRCPAGYAITSLSIGCASDDDCASHYLVCSLLRNRN